jgi:hypothetical protein
MITLAGFWSILLFRVVAGLVSGGADGARGTLHRAILAIGLWRPIDPLLGVSRGYEALLFCLLLTWALREVYSWLSKAEAQE